MAEDLKDISSIAALDHQLRRSMYLLIRRARKPLSREDISGELGISIKLAAFHLDKLVDRGLLKAHYARGEGKAGPGGGRSSKFYEPSEKELGVSLPARHYDLIGSLLIETLHRFGDEDGTEIGTRLGRQKGREIAGELRARVSKRRRGPRKGLSIAEESLDLLGYEPFRASVEEVRLKNCPFRNLAKQAPELVCPINKALIEGLARDLDVRVIQIAVGPPDGDCCVALRSRQKSGKRKSSA
jgi:predicted ArsR family transcriptional regulator